MLSTLLRVVALMACFGSLAVWAQTQENQLV